MQNTSFSLTIVAPVYNEENVISHFHSSLKEVLGSLDNVVSKVIYVVDPCTDNSLEILRDLAKHDAAIKVISLSSRCGHQMSLAAGIDHAQDSDVVITMDCDLQHPPQLIPKLLEKYLEGFDVVYTERRGTENINWVRQKAGNIFYWALARLSDAPIRANVADYRLFSRRVARIISEQFRDKNVFLRGNFALVGFKQVGIEYIASERVAGRSKYNFYKTLQLATTAILTFSTKPLRLAIVFGAAFAAISVFMMLWTAVAFFGDKTIPSGWATLAILQLFFGAIQLLVIGILGGYVGTLYEEVRARPRYIVDEVISSDDQ